MECPSVSRDPLHLQWLCAQEVEGRYLDTDGFEALAFRIKGDGRKYIASLRTDNWIVGSNSHDVWQAFLFARCDGHSSTDVGTAAACRRARKHPQIGP